MIELSDCETFLTVDDMKFMAIESSEVCDDCHFNLNGCTTYFHSTCIGDHRYDSRNVIWLRIL